MSNLLNSSVFEDHLFTHQHEATLLCSDPQTGLKAIVGLHDTTLGPALGGCRMKPYASETEALQDVLNLSRAMTYKASVAGLNLGGGKTVVILNDPKQKTPELLKALAQRINLLRGSYIGAGDVGSTTDDLKIMKQVCPWIVGLATEDGGLGDSAILTAFGVFQGIRAAVLVQKGADSLNGLHVGVQGVGKVGRHLVELLLEAGCQVTIADTSPEAIAATQKAFPSVASTSLDVLHTLDLDVFSPNAIGGTVTPEVVNSLKARMIVGAANNPLASEAVSRLLAERGILYAPDFVVNAGGLIMVAAELDRLSFEQAQQKVAGIYQTTLNVFKTAEAEKLLPLQAARHLAEQRIAAARQNPQRPLLSSVNGTNNAASARLPVFNA